MFNFHPLVSTMTQNKIARSKAEEIAAACMAQLLGMGLLLISPKETLIYRRSLMQNKTS